MTTMKTMLFKTSKIRIDEKDRVCLNDVHRAAGFSKNQTPADWTRLPSFSREIASVLKRVTGKSHNWSKEEIKSVLYTVRTGNGKGTWANENIALGYAAYLSSDLAVEIRDVFLRYKKADATLADDVLSRATPEQNEWAGKRALGRAKRKEFTAVLKEHGVDGWGYAEVTDAAYKALFSKTAKQLRSSRGIPKSAAVRDNFSTDEIISVMFAEMLSGQRIEDEDAHGNRECELATKRSSRIVRAAIDENRSDQQPRLMP